MWNVVRWIGYTAGGYALRGVYNWLTEDLDPEPGTKQFNKEYKQTYAKYNRLRRKYEAYRESNKRSNKGSNTTD